MKKRVHASLRLLDLMCNLDRKVGKLFRGMFMQNLKGKIIKSITLSPDRDLLMFIFNDNVVWRCV